MQISISDEIIYMELKTSYVPLFCAQKHMLIDELAALSEQHFKLTSTLLQLCSQARMPPQLGNVPPEDGSLAKVMQECTRVRVRWVEAERLLNKHVQVHHCQTGFRRPWPEAHPTSAAKADPRFRHSSIGHRPGALWR
jgi:hypothetical protein